MFGHRKKVPKILIVEDLEVNNALYREVFEAAGFEVVVLQKIGDDFIENVCALAPDIISMDLMFEQDVTDDSFAGLDLLYLLKEDARTKSVPVIILTAFFEESKVLKAKSLGAVDFISASGQPVQKLPDIFRTYLEDPKHYAPRHPLFRS